MSLPVSLQTTEDAHGNTYVMSTYQQHLGIFSDLPCPHAVEGAVTALLRRVSIPLITMPTTDWTEERHLDADHCDLSPSMTEDTQLS